jgi:peptide/nickel transport system substrate-binding protein
MEKLNRRDFLRGAAMTAAGAALIACQPQTVIVEKEKVVKETVEVEKVVKETVQVEVEKVVKETVQVEKVVEVTAAPSEVKEAPALLAQVTEGKLPPVGERIPSEALVIDVVDEIGVYGGTWRRVAIAPNDVGIINSRLGYVAPLRYTAMAVDIVAFVAKGFEASEDASEFTFYLRKGMKWADGEPYTVDDIMFWYNDMMNNAEYSPAGMPGWLKVEGQPVVVEKVDDYTVKYKFASTYGLFIAQMASTAGLGIFARHPVHYLTQFHPAYVDKADLDAMVKDAGFGTWVELFNNKLDWRNTEFPNVWPWLMAKAPPEIPAVAERNAYFFSVDPSGNQLPYIDRLRFEVVENIQILNMKAIAGAVDMQFRHITWENFPLYMDNAATGEYRVMKWILAEGSNYLLHPNMNHKDPGLRELMEIADFRHALSLAIDRDEINQVAYAGLGTPRQASVLPVLPQYKESQSEAYAAHDVDAANNLLDGIGLTARDSEGMRLRLDGQALTINIEYAPVFGPWADVTQMICNYWKDIGVRAFPKEESRPLFAERADLGTEQDMSVWTMDRSAHFLVEPLYQLPRRSGTPPSTAALYWDWWNSDGAQGEEPTPEILQAYELYEKCKTARNQNELNQYGTELLDLNAAQTWFIGTVGLLPHVGVVKNSFFNVPEQAVSDWLCLTPGNTYIEQYFIKET